MMIMMIDFIHFPALLALASLWCFGFYIACQYDKEVKREIASDCDGWVERHIITNKMVLWWYGYGCEFLPWYLNKPLCKCVTCMASVHGSAVFFLFYPIDGPINETITTWIFFIGCLAGTNQLAANYFEVD